MNQITRVVGSDIMVVKVLVPGISGATGATGPQGVPGPPGPVGPVGGTVTDLSTKSPYLDWQGTPALSLGTSIPHQGGDVDSYLEIAMTRLGGSLVNMAWSGSCARYDKDYDPFNIVAVKRLSMTEDDRQWGLATYGPTSAYDDSFDAVTKASKMTCDYRIDQQFALTPFRVVFFDHNHNDRDSATYGSAGPFETVNIVSITKGATTQVTLASIGSIVVGNGIVLRVTGIASLDHAAVRVQAVVGSTITINIDSSAYAGTFSSGTCTKYDRATLNGSFRFLYHRIKRAGFLAGVDPIIIYNGAPSDYTNGAFDAEIRSSAELIKTIADELGCAFFDEATALADQLGFHGVYFPDNVHPLETIQRKALANLWAEWMAGGGSPIIDPAAYVPAPVHDLGVPPAYTDQSPLIYSRFLGGAGTPDIQVGAPSVAFTDDFASGIGTWASNGVAPVFQAAPWGSGQAIKCVTNSGAAQPSSYLSRNITLGRGRIAEFDFYLPQVSGLSALASQQVGMFHLRSGGAYYSLGLHITSVNTTFILQYFETPNTTLHGLVIPQNLLEANRKYRVRLEMYQGSSANAPGSLIMYLDGVQFAGPYAMNDFGQTAIASMRLGNIASNTGQALTIYLSNLTLSNLPTDSISARKTGTISGINFVGGWATGGDGTTASVEDWRGVGGDSTDTGTLLNAIAAAKAAGGMRLRMPARYYTTTQTLVIDESHVHLIGEGSGADKVESPVDTSPRTKIKWGGAAGGTIMRLITPATGSGRKVGGGLEGIMLDGNDFLAARGLVIESRENAYFHDVYVWACSESCFRTSVVNYEIVGTNSADVQRCYFNKCFASTRGKNTTPYLTAATIGWHLTGGSPTHPGNTSGNTFIACHGYMSKGLAWKLENTDDNFFYWISGGAVYDATVYGMELGSADQDTTSALSATNTIGKSAARFNMIFGTGMTVNCRSSQTGLGSSTGNMLIGFSRANNWPPPNIETPAGGSKPATLYYLDTHGNSRVGRLGLDEAAEATFPQEKVAGLTQLFADNGVLQKIDGAGRVSQPLIASPSAFPNRDQAPAIYSRFMDGIGTPGVVVGTPAAVFSDDFSAGLGTWTTVGTAPFIEAAPWGSGQSIKCVVNSAVSVTTSYLSRAITLDKGRVVEFDMWLPQVVGLTPTGTLKVNNLVSLRNPGAYYVFGLNITPTQAYLTFSAFETPNVNPHSFQAKAPLAANTKYRIKLEMYQGIDATIPGRMLIYSNGVLAIEAPWSVPDHGQVAITQIYFGSHSSNTGQSLTVYLGNLTVSDMPINSIAARKTGTLSGIDFVGGWATGGAGISVPTPLLVNVENYRGVGGDFSDTGTLQNACNAGVPLQLPPILTITAQINITKGGTSLYGNGWGTDTAVATQPGAGTRIIWGGGTPTAGTTMLNVKSAVASSYLWDFNISGVYLLGQNLAPVGLRLSSTRTAHIGRLFVERCTENHVLLDDGNGVLHYSTGIDELYITAGTSPLTLNANGLNIREVPGANTVGCTWIHGAFIQAGVQNGDGVIFGNVDNCQFSKIGSGSSGGKAIRFRGLSDGQHQVSRKNFIRQFSGNNIYAETKSRNVVDWINSEGTSVTIEAGGALHYGVLDREDGRRWHSFAYDISSQFNLPVANGYAVTGSPVLSTVGTQKLQVVFFDPVTTETWGWVLAPQRVNSGGRIVKFKATGIKSTSANAGDVQWQVSVKSTLTTQSLGTGFVTQAYTHSVDAAAVQSYEEFTIAMAAPPDYVFDGHMVVQLSRLGADAADTYPDDWCLLSFQVLTEAKVADSDLPAYRYDDSPDKGDIT